MPYGAAEPCCSDSCCNGHRDHVSALAETNPICISQTDSPFLNPITHLPSITRRRPLARILLPDAQKTQEATICPDTSPRALYISSKMKPVLWMSSFRPPSCLITVDASPLRQVLPAARLLPDDLPVLEHHHRPPGHSACAPAGPAQGRVGAGKARVVSTSPDNIRSCRLIVYPPRPAAPEYCPNCHTASTRPSDYETRSRNDATS